jgi:hypothetical protein
MTHENIENDHNDDQGPSSAEEELLGILEPNYLVDYVTAEPEKGGKKGRKN